MKQQGYSGSLAKAFDILDYLADRQGQAGLSEISRDIGMNKTTVFRYLETFVQLGILSKQDNVYFFGLKLFELGNRVRAKELVVKKVHPLLEKLSAEVNETVNLAQYFDGTVIYLDKAESRHSLQMTSAVGDRLPLYCTAIGKAILSLLDSREIVRFFEQTELEPKTETTITDKDILLDQIEKIRTSGYGLEQDELEEGLSCVSVPLEIPSLDFVGALSVSAPSVRLRGGKIAEIVSRLKETRDKIIAALR